MSVAALQATICIKIILGRNDAIGRVTQLDLWAGRTNSITVSRQPNCPACDQGRFEFLSAERTAWVTKLCGRNAVQITPPEPTELDLEAMREALSTSVATAFNGLLLTLKTDSCEIIVFPDGRAMVKGTTDETVARRFYAQYIGG